MMNRAPLLAAVLGLAARRIAGQRAARAGQLTVGQQQTLHAIRVLSARRGYAPTLAEISDAMGVSWSMVRDHLAVLKRKGHVRQATTDEGRAIPRTLAVVTTSEGP